MSARLRIDILGAFRVSASDDGSINSVSRHAQALIALLALSRDGHASREWAASLLWEDRGDEQARHSLRQCLLGLRKAIDDPAGEIIRSESADLFIDAELAEIDAIGFIRLAEQTDEAEIEEALRLYRGPLLNGLSITSESFTEWLEEQRAYLHRLYRQALSRLSQLRLERDDAEAAADLAHKLIASDNLDESAHRLLMQALDAQGRRAEAIRQYNVLVETLRREVSSEPADETRALAESFRNQSRPETAENPSTETIPATPHTLEPKEEREAEAATQEDPVNEVLQPAENPLSIVRIVSYSGQWVRPVAYGLVGLLALIAVAFLVDWMLGPDSRSLRVLLGISEAHAPRLAIRPFKVTNDDPVEVSLAWGLSEDIGAALSSISTIRVLGYAATTIKPENPPPGIKFGQTNDVDFVLEGRVQRTGEAIRIWVKLFDHDADEQLWVGRYSGDLEDIFNLQDSITLEVVTALQVELTEGEQERLMLSHGTRNLDAWLLTSKGAQLLRRLTRLDIERARDLYLEALALDPDYPGAWEGLAWTNFLPVWLGWSQDPLSDLAEAKRHAEKALELDPMRSRSYSLGGIIAMVSSGCDEAIESGERAIELGPQDAEASAILAYILSYCGDPDRSVELMQTALLLSPYPPRWYWWNLGRAYRLTGRLQEAVVVLSLDSSESVLSIEPKVELVLALAAWGRISEAKVVVREILNLQPHFSVARWSVRTAYLGDSKPDEEILLLRMAGVPDY